MQEMANMGELPETIDGYIREGIARGRERERRRRAARRRNAWSGAAVCVLLIGCLLTIRISPVFASIVRDIPGMQAFVDLIRASYDRGVNLAVDNEFVQPVGVTDEHDGTAFTVEGIVADESRMIVFYTVRSDVELASVRLDPKLTDGNGESLQAMIGFSYPEEAKPKKKEPGVYRGTIDVQLVNDKVLPNEVTLRVKLEPGGRVDTSRNDIFAVQIPIDHARFANMKQEYELGQTIEAEGQRITFVRATVQPLRIAVELAYDENNGKQVFDAGDIRLTDEKGNVWKWFSGTSRDDNHDTIYFESTYFHQPRELYIEGSWFRALDKDRMTITIDTDRERIVRAPDDKLQSVAVSRNGSYSELRLQLNVDNPDDTMGYSLFRNEYMDASGRQYRLADRSGIAVGKLVGSKEQTIYYNLDNTAYQQPLTFQIYSYPSYIRQPYRIRIR